MPRTEFFRACKLQGMLPRNETKYSWRSHSLLLKCDDDFLMDVTSLKALSFSKEKDGIESLLEAIDMF